MGIVFNFNQSSDVNISKLNVSLGFLLTHLSPFLGKQHWAVFKLRVIFSHFAASASYTK